MNYNDIRKNEEVVALIHKGNEYLGRLGYTDHSEAHVTLVAMQAAHILESFGYDEHTVELAKIASFMHDIGNAVNRSHHGEYGALLAYDILKKNGMPLDDCITIMSAIGNHDESTGTAIDTISAALIIADKSDVRRTRVRNTDIRTFDIHDRVNYAVTDSHLRIDPIKKTISLDLKIDESICTMYEYFDIFLGRMQMCRHAAEVLGAMFKLTVNGGKVL
ncbi:MAG: HD domain-containing protein [Erysipelotrichaceae bacterium]|nr:HD domain-containing protein [Erysipelotrichaceae bacterium]